jgi:hypothetical protein
MKRTVLLASAWTASAAAAVGLGFLAVSLVDASASSGTADLTTSSVGTPTAAAPVTQSPEAVPAGQQVTLGGTVYGSCENGVPVLASAPAAGWWLDDSDDAAEAAFEDGTLKIEVKVACVDGVPQFSVEGPRRDSSQGGDDGVTSAPAAPTTSPSGDDSDGSADGEQGSDDGVPAPSAATTTSAPSSASGDDSDGRVGGGQGSDDDSGWDDSGSGSDDSGWDDSGRRGGGGNGSDD